jgi:TonB family protein
MHPRLAQSAFIRRPLPVKGFLLASLAGHGGLLFALTFAHGLFAPPPLDLNQKPIRATLVRQGKPRDPDLLPRKEELPPPPQKVEAETPPAPAPPEAKPPEKPAVPVPVPTAKPEPPKTAQKQPGEKDGQDRRKQLFGAFSRTGKAAKAEELEGQEDGSPLGDSATAEGDPYWALLQAQIHRFFDLSETIPDDERIRLRAVLRLRIGQAGQLLRADLDKASGNSLFDSAILSAAKKAAPFSPPPERFRRELQSRGVSLEFIP